MPVLDRVDTLDVNTQYYFAFDDSTDNLKRVMINGEEVELTATSGGKRTPNRILRSFDDEIFIEFEGADDTDKMLNAFANNDVSVAIAKVVEGEEPSYAYRENSMHTWVREGETYEVKFFPMHGEELIRFDIAWNSITIADESRLVKNADGSYSFTITYDEINEKTFDILAVFSGGTNDDNAVEYMFIGDFNEVYASADYNNDVTYEGFEFMQQDVVGYYIGKVVENGQAANSEGAVEFWMPNANDTFRAYRNDVNMTNLFVPNGSGGWMLTSNEAWVHAPAHWVIIREDDLMKYDVNRDSNITIADVTKLVNKILGKE